MGVRTLKDQFWRSRTICVSNQAASVAEPYWFTPWTLKKWKKLLWRWTNGKPKNHSINSPTCTLTCFNITGHCRWTHPSPWFWRRQLSIGATSWNPSYRWTLCRKEIQRCTPSFISGKTGLFLQKVALAASKIKILFIVIVTLYAQPKLWCSPGV